MEFDGFLGPEHLLKMLVWIDNIPYPDYCGAAQESELMTLARSSGNTVFTNTGLSTEGINLEAVALYNVQDFLFQRPYRVPSSQRIRTFLDYGAGHGRQAALAFAPGSDIECFIAMDAMPACYLTQRVYYHALGYGLHDYQDAKNRAEFTPREGKKLISHIPSWRDDQ